MADGCARMGEMDDGMKGQYFSFDAVIATVIMVLAFSSLVAYWYGAQAVVEERTDSRLADANRVAEALLSPGSPGNWENGIPLSEVRQIGITKAFGNELDDGKINALMNLAASHYDISKTLLRTGGDYYIVIQQTDDPGGIVRVIGSPYSPAVAKTVAVANRGAVLDGHPMRVRVFLWK